MSKSIKALFGNVVFALFVDGESSNSKCFEVFVSNLIDLKTFKCLS